MSAFVPLARSNSGMTSSISDFIAPPLKTLIWFVLAIGFPPAFAPKQRAANVAAL